MEKKTIKIDISLRKPKYEAFLFYNGKISISEDSIVVSGCLDREHAGLLSVAYRAVIDLHYDFENFVKYKNGISEGQPVKIINNEDEKKGRSVLSFNTRSIADGGSEYIWSLSKLSLSYKSSIKDNTIILNVPYTKLAKGIGNFNGLPDTINFTSGTYTVLSRRASNVNHTVINTENLPQKVIDAFITHASFYFNSLCNIIKCSTNVDGEQIEKYQIPDFVNTTGFACLPELNYINFNKERSFVSFFQQSQWYRFPDEKLVKLRNAVYTLVRCKYCDNTTEFLLLYSILDRYVGNSYGLKPYPVVKGKLAERNIDIEKIGPKVDPSLQILQLKLIRDNGKEEGVSNFCNLRNYIMHFMANASIDEFLRKSSLVSNMRFSVTIILLQEFGFQNIYFPKEWSHLSVLLHNAEENVRGTGE